MPAYIPAPPGLEVPAPGETFDLTASVQVTEDGQLYVVAVNGIPLEGDVEETLPMDEEPGFLGAVEDALV